MALVQCPECGSQVSTAAAACPKCGSPIGSPAVGTPLSTIQQTSKRLKAQIILSSLAFGIGLVWVLTAFAGDAENPSLSPIAVTLFLVGMICYLTTKFRIWWHHK